MKKTYTAPQAHSIHLHGEDMLLTASPLKEANDQKYDNFESELDDNFDATGNKYWID